MAPVAPSEYALVGVATPAPQAPTPAPQVTVPIASVVGTPSPAGSSSDLSDNDKKIVGGVVGGVGGAILIGIIIGCVIYNRKPAAALADPANAAASDAVAEAQGQP